MVSSVMCSRVLLAAAVLAGVGEAAVYQVTNQADFKKLLNKKADGLPVVVDFYSDGCGPCRMVAPIYKAMSKEYKGKAIFAKVDVNRAQVGEQIRSMPTFQFWYNGKKKHQFSGADERGIRQTVDNLIVQAQKDNVELSEDSLKKFYEKHDPEKVDKVAETLGKYGGNGAKINKLATGLEKKYGEKPELTERPWPRPQKNKDGEAGGAGGKKITDYSMEELMGEIERREDEDESMQVEQRKRRRKLEKVVVVGGGPAGLSAAVYAARAGLKPVVAAPAMGGQLMSKGVDVENYPGLLRTTGTKMVDMMRKQAAKFGTTFEFSMVTNVDLSQRPFTVDLNGTEVKTQTIIIATGADSKWLGVEGEDDFKGLGVSSCATCDGFLFKDKDVVVVGGGDTAMEEALVLARICTSVTLVHRRDTFRASLVMQEAVKKHKKISIVYDTTVTKFAGSDAGLEKVHLKNTKTGEESELPVAAAFVAIGHNPNTWLFKGQLDMDETGYINTKSGSTHTSVDGVFASGDVADHVYRQAITSGGTGAMASLDAERWLSEHGDDLELDHPSNLDLPDYTTWRVKMLRQELVERKIDQQGCVEKACFIDRLFQWHSQNPHL